MFKVSGWWGWMGASLSLIALYLLLEHAQGAGQLAQSGSSALGNLYKILQGRN